MGVLPVLRWVPVWVPPRARRIARELSPFGSGATGYGVAGQVFMTKHATSRARVAVLAALASPTSNSHPVGSPAELADRVQRVADELVVLRRDLLALRANAFAGTFEGRRNETLAPRSAVGKE